MDLREDERQKVYSSGSQWKGTFFCWIFPLLREEKVYLEDLHNGAEKK